MKSYSTCDINKIAILQLICLFTRYIYTIIDVPTVFPYFIIVTNIYIINILNHTWMLKLMIKKSFLSVNFTKNYFQKFSL